MRDWAAFVRSRLSLPDLSAERESRIVRELAAQLEDFYREAIARGVTHEEADAHARAQVTDWDRMARDLRQADARHVRPRLERLTTRLEDTAERPGVSLMIAHLLTDIRFALRQMIKAPGFTAVATLTLALGIGATSAIFSVVNGVMLRPLPFPQPDRLLFVVEIVPQYGRFAVAPANFLDWRRQAASFERMAAYFTNTDTYVTRGGPERLDMAFVSWDTFDVLGVRPVLGRSFRREEDQPKRNDVIVLSHGMWQRRLGGDPNVIGRTIALSGAPVTVVGVMPAHFYFPNRTVEFWRPIALDGATATRGGHFLGVVARLKPGLPLEQAEAEMRGIAGRLAQQYPDSNRDESAELIRMHDLIVGPVRPMLMTLLAAVAMVVLIACANVANLLLSRASVREKEIAIRTAMGAGRGRIVTQLLVESLVLALAAGTVGLLLAWVSIRPIQTLSAGSIPRVADIALDPTVLAFALVVTLATVVLFGLAPAWQASRGRASLALKEGGRSTATSGARRLRGALLIAEVALSIVLLVGAALLLRSFAEVMKVEPGFDPGSVLTFRVALPQSTYTESQPRIAFFDRLLDALRTTPGMTRAAMVQQLPMRGDYFLSFTIEGRPSPRGQDPSANYRAISPEYFSTLGIPLLRGRVFDERDTDKAPMAAVVDEAFAKRYFPNEDPIGRGIDIGNGTDGFYRIVGIVGNVHHEALDAAAGPTMYAPFKSDVFGTMWVIVRTEGDPARFAAAARQAVARIDPGIPAFSMAPLADVITESVARRRFAMLLLGLFALVALFLAAVGLYGVVAYGVSQRTQEIGVRIAIGARPDQVLRLILGEGMKLALVGVAAGVAGALALADVVASLLFGVTPFDPASYAATVALLLAVAALACYLPARRAMTVDPLVALRQE